MADWESIAAGLWKGLATLDPGPADEEAQKTFRLAFVGAGGSGKTALACALAAQAPLDAIPERLQQYVTEYRLPLRADDVQELESASVLLLLLDATKAGFVDEVAAADYLSYLGRPMLVCYSKMDLVPVETRLMHGQARWRGVGIMPLTATDADTVSELLLPAVLEALPGYSLALARQLSLFRGLVLEELIERTARVNATYASATGLAERIPLRRMPLNDDDVRVLGANQAAMVYRLGLAYGLPPNWHTDAQSLRLAVELPELWRFMARRAVGLIPLWGLNSKVGLAYSGTVATGRAIQSWFKTGQRMAEPELRDLCREVAAQTRETSDDVAAKARDALPSPQPKAARAGGWNIRLGRSRRSSRPPRPVCPLCHRANPSGAAFCAYCGVPFGEAESRDAVADSRSDEHESQELAGSSESSAPDETA